jgi:hypothetical protein
MAVDYDAPLEKRRRLDLVVDYGHNVDVQVIGNAELGPVARSRSYDCALQRQRC